MKSHPNNTPNGFAAAQHIELCTLGDNAFNNGRYAEARKYFKVALEFCSDDCDAWWALGYCYDKLKKPRQAEDCFKMALEFADDESLPELQFSLGNCLFDQAEYEAAIESFLKIPKGTAVWFQASKNIKLAQEKLKPEKG